MKNRLPFPKNIKKPILVLAPMAGYTESPFRRLVKEIEPSTVLVSELISAEALRRENKKTREMIAFSAEEEKFYGVQLFGNEESAFISSAKILEDLGADFIDINLGCPSPKVIGSGYGSALLKDISRTAKLIEVLVKSTTLPVTVKMRLGFYDDSEFINSAKTLESAGIAWLAIHGRTTTQKFEGTAHWEKIYEVKEHIKIPVIGNGDIVSAEMAEEKLKNLDGIMIGRAAIQNPWIFRQIRDLFEGKLLLGKPEIRDQIKFFRRQADISISERGEISAILGLRKHFAHFVREIPKAGHFRDRLIRVSTQKEMNEIFEEILSVLE